MAKDQTSKRRPEPTFDGKTREDLLRELGLEELTYEACFHSLFAELLDDLMPSASDTGGGRVTQMGPGRRTKPPKGD